ncbi:MAG: NADPH:quinone oxidoreductase family protein [Candidatus Heimdallarchaeota archaeon]|nr:NADPH:quinone oxidoreductase family protein [Candidatus Heimdallarchaeota archaeon]
MKAILLDKIGRSDVLQVKNVPKPDITTSNELLINLKYSGINFAEILARRGLYKWVPSRTGFILGMEGAGIVEEIGSDVTNFKKGDSVIVARGFGCHAEYISLDKKYVFPAIPGYTLQQNAAFSGSFLTAYIALVQMARVRAGETILVQAAAGALGTATVILAKALGLKVAGTASSPEKINILQNYGVDLGINYSKLRFKDKILEWTNFKGVDVVLESVGGEIFRDSLLCLSPMGRLVFVGLSSIRFNKFNPLTWWSTYKLIPRINLLNMLGKSQGILAFHVGRLLDTSYTELREVFEDLVDFVSQHQITPPIGRIFPLERIAEAHQLIESRQSIGKVLLEI